MTAITGFSPTNTPLDSIYGEGVVYIGSTPIGVTKGGVKFDPARSFSQPDFDGKYANIKGLHRPINGTPTLSFTMLEFGGASGGAQIAKLEPGQTAVTVSTTTTHTPATSGAFLASGAYLTDVRVLFEKGSAGSGSYVGVHFTVGLCVKYDISGADKANGAIPVVIEGCIDPATQALGAPAYTIEERTTLP